MAGGTMPPVRSDDDSVTVRLSEGYAILPDDAVDRHGVDFLANLGGVPAANIHLVSDWIRDHFGPDGEFRCPSSTDESGDDDGRTAQ